VRCVTASALPAPDVVDLAGALRFLVPRLHRQLRQQDSSGLSPALAGALATIAREGPMTLSRLAAAEQVTPPTVTKLVDKLVDAGLVVRRDDPADRRVTRVAATAAGRRRLDAIRTRRAAWLAARLGELPPADLRRLEGALDVLERLAAPPGALDPEDPPT